MDVTRTDFIDDPSGLLVIKEYPLPDSNLKYEYVTLTPDFMSDKEVLFCWFRSAISYCNSQNCNQIVNEMIKVFRHYKEDCSMLHIECVLSEGIVAVCYRLQIDDSQLIKQVLDFLYESWSTGDGLDGIEPLHSPHYIETTDGNTNDPPDCLSFFLEHARRLKFEYCGTRFIDVNIEHVMRLVFTTILDFEWKPLLRYLQFGAEFEYVMRDPPYIYYKGMQYEMTPWLHYLIGELWYHLVQPSASLSLSNPEVIQEYCSKLNRESLDICQTIKIILRAVKRLFPEDLDFIIFRDFGTYVADSRKVLNHPTVQLMLPTLSQRCRFPIQLQHACRWSIRSRLNENWQLPAGIDQLPIPNKLKMYLNLLSD